MELTEKQRRYLRGLAHLLDPIIMVGHQGVTPSVVAETTRALHDHELIKVKIRGADRDARNKNFAQLATLTGSNLVHRIGHVGVLYRHRNDKPGIVIPAA